MPRAPPNLDPALKALYAFCPPWQTCSFRHQLGFSGRHSSYAAITHNDYITHISSTVYSQVLIYTAESTGASMERTKMPNLRNGSKGDSNPCSLDCESGILLLSYLASCVLIRHSQMCPTKMKKYARYVRQS